MQRRLGGPSMGVARGTATLCVLLFVTVTTARAERVYTIGNSLTDCLNFDGFKALAQSKGKTFQIGRHMIPGAPLDWNWDHPGDCIPLAGADFSGCYQQALSTFAFDVLWLQACFTRCYADEISYATQYMDLALQKNAQVQTYAYMTWQLKGSDWSTWEGKSCQPMTFQNVDVRENWEKFAVAVTARRPSARPVHIIPVGEVMFRLKKKIALGQVSSLSSIDDLYNDDIHLNGIGSYTVAVTAFATIYKTDPRGMSTQGYSSLSPGLVSAIQQTAWEVMTGYKDGSGKPWSGWSSATAVAAGRSPQSAHRALVRTGSDRSSGRIVVTDLRGRSLTRTGAAVHTLMGVSAGSAGGLQHASLIGR